MGDHPLLRHETTGRSTLERLKDTHCLAAPCFPCLRLLAEKALYEQLQAFGANEEADAENEHLDFSLFRGAFIAPFSSKTVELEYTGAPANDRGRKYSDEESHRLQKDALDRMREFYQPLVPVGCVLYALTLGGGYLSGRWCECAGGPSLLSFLLPVLAIVVQVYWLNRLTLLVSQTEVEGRPMLRLLRSLEGLDKYHVMSALGVLDTFSRFTRAQFVGYIDHCHDSVDRPFTEVFEGYGLYQQLMDYLGIAGLSVASFITGPLLIQFGYMWHLRRKLLDEFAEALQKQPGEDMEVMDSVDELGALMTWAMLEPAGKVMDLAAIPLEVKSDTDLDRVWGRMKTQVLAMLARDIPDGVMQMNLQAWFFCLVYANISWSVRLQLLFNITLAGGNVLFDALQLVAMNRRVTVLAGVALLLMMAAGVARTVGAFTCSSGIIGINWHFTCLPVGQIDVGNWNSGTLPG